MKELMAMLSILILGISMGMCIIMLLDLKVKTKRLERQDEWDKWDE